jgi:hypothetical protein
MSMPNQSILEIGKKLTETLLPSWQLREEQYGFLVTTPKGPTGIELQHKLSDEAWRLAKTVGYKKFTSIEKTPEGAFLVYSRDASDNWFQILVDKE